MQYNYKKPSYFPHKTIVFVAALGGLESFEKNWLSDFRTAMLKLFDESDK